MDKIIIEKLKIDACHGVNPSEKKNPQRFEFSAEISSDFNSACETDDVSNTINYSAVCKIIKSVATSHTYNLIETLARRCAEAIMDNFPSASGVRLRVDKPDAPINARFSSVAVETELERVKAYLSIGSSLGDKKKYLDFAVKSLSLSHGIEVKKVSSYIESEPYGGVAKNTFLNACVEIETYLPPQTLLSTIQCIEDEAERVRALRWDDRTLDIDIIFYGDKIINSDTLTVPHHDFLNRPFVIDPLKEIAPRFICPMTGAAVKDLPHNTSKTG